MAQFFGLDFAVLFNETPGFGRLQCNCHITIVHGRSPASVDLCKSISRGSRQRIERLVVAWFQNINNPLPICRTGHEEAGREIREAHLTPNVEGTQVLRLPIHIGSHFHPEFSQLCRDAETALFMPHVSRDLFHISIESVETLRPLRQAP